MSKQEGNILLLANNGIAEQIKAQAGKTADRVIHRQDPYDALKELAGRKYDAVIISQDYPDLEGLVRAVRRLQKSTKIFALLSPAGEADLKTHRIDQLDDYFIFPPSREDLEMIFSSGERPDTLPGTPIDKANLKPSEVAELIEAADSLKSLKERIASCVERWTQIPVRWCNATDIDKHASSLLVLDSDPPEALVSNGEVNLAHSMREKLAALQVLVGPLVGQARKTEALHRLAITDYLTGAYNRRYFYHFTDQLLERAKSERFRVTLLLYDIDDFKRYNDTFGHLAGDEILRETAALMKQITRKHDIVARIGGDEFAVLFWDAEPPRQPGSRHPETAYILADRFVKALANHRFSFLRAEAKGTLTISGGLATFPWDGQTCRELLRHADMAMRKAKRSGKNAIYIVGGKKDSPDKATTNP